VTIQDMSTLARRMPARRPVLKAAVIVGALLAAGAAIGWALNTRAVADDGRDVATVSRQATSATEAIDGLSARLADVRHDVAAIKDDNAHAAARLERVTGALWASLKKLRGTVADARSGSNSALADAESALQRAESAARDLSVLTDRFDYHLRADHGGG
jgi:chromosome segregation ATPase